MHSSDLDVHYPLSAFGFGTQRQQYDTDYRDDLLTPAPGYDFSLLFYLHSAGSSPPSSPPLYDLPPYHPSLKYEDENDDNYISSIPMVASNEDIVSEIEEMVESNRSQSGNSPNDNTHLAYTVHARPMDDVHYPYPELRKKRTRMRSGVCVWCAVYSLMPHPERPKLLNRMSSSDANWEKWLRELDSPRRGFLSHLVNTLLPKARVLQFITPQELPTFYQDLAGALIELALRELRDGSVDDRLLMAQVRSSKYHKTARVAGILEGAYA